MMRSLLIPLALVPLPAVGAPLAFKPIIDVRLRYEGVDQTGTPREADAVTVRVRSGFEIKKSDFAFLAEAEATLAVSENYNSGLNGKTAFGVVADPQNVELNRLQVHYTGLPKTIVTVGRQRINLDDQRFVGSVGWRQNEQTFDAARIEYSGIKNVKADVTYAWSNRTIWGVDGVGARQPAINGDNVFATVAYKHKYGALTGFAYLVDQDEAAVNGFRLSSQTFGVRYAGIYPVSKTVKLSIAASYAKQSDYHRNPNDYSADYLAAELGLEAKDVRLLAGYEKLGSDRGTALTSFQTPLATLHKFNGWADKFLTTPPNGLQDIYATIGYAKPKAFGFDSIALSATYHDFNSDRLNQQYGDEINLQLLAKIKRYTLTLKYADYNAASFATDTKKLWASVEWAL